MRFFTNRLVNSARVRLAGTYLVIIMVLSMGFSTIFYIQSVNEATSNLNRQSVELRDYLYFTTPKELQSIQDGQLTIFKGSLMKQLSLLNMGMFVLGTVVSLLLAERSLRPLAEALESQSRFTSDASHELRTPLTAMKTEIEVTLRDKKLKKDDAVATLNSSLEEIVKLEALISALLRLARDPDSIDKSYWQDYKIADILTSAIERQIDQAREKNISVSMVKTDLTVHGDADQLIELFVTILANAIKYSYPDTAVNIKVSNLSDSFVQIDVIDKGMGITEVDLPHIFDRFYRADPSRNKTQADGYGLGLSLAKAIVNQHGGKVSVRSRYDKGSVFSVILPS